MAQPREVLRLDSFCRMLVVVIITAALLLRIWALDAAISPVADPDEQQVICSAMGLHSESSPHALAGNALATYVSSLSYAAWYGVGRIVGRFGSVLDFGAEFFHDPRPFFMVARLASVAAGMLSVYLAFLIGRRLLDRWFGLALCLLVAVHPAAVAHAHQAQSHAFALALVLFGSWAVLSQGRGIEAIVADLTMGFAVGLAAEVTPAYLLILPVFLAYRGWTGRRQHRGLTLLGFVGAAGAAYVGMIVVGSTTGALCLVPRALTGYAQLFEATSAVWMMVTGALLVAMSYLLRSHLTPIPAAGTVLTGALLLAWPGLCRSIENNAMRSVPPATELAASWIADNIPPGSTILVGQHDLASLTLPRTEESWRRELAHGTVSQQWPCGHSRPLCLMGIYAARSHSDHAFDIVLQPGSQTLRQPTESSSGDSATLERPIEYIVSTASSGPPDDLAVAPEGISHLDEYWLLARFSAPNAASQAVSIWALGAPADGLAPPPSIPWLMHQAPDLALVPVTPLS